MNPAVKLADGMELIIDYKDNKAYRDSFNALAALVFGINFEEWYQKGFWDDRYVCHSVLYSNKIIANISISKMELIIDGLPLKAIQIGTVMTHPDYRGMGLSRFLMSHVLELYELECDVFFLFANSTVHDFYPKFAFTPVLESQFSLDVTDLRRENGAMRKLDMARESDLTLVVNLVAARKSISREFGVEKHLGIFMFYVINMFADCIYYLEQENVLVLFEQKDEVLQLYDVVSGDYKGLHALLAKIVDEHTKTIHFHFTPTLLTNEAKVEPLDLSEDLLFIKTTHEWVKTVFRAPKTAHA